MKIFKNNFMDVELLDSKKNNILITWKSETQYFEENTFKECFLEYKDKVLASIKPQGILHDLSLFFYTIVPKLQEWVDTEINLYAVRNGAKFGGFVVSPEIFTQVSVEQTMEESDKPVNISYFDNLESAKQWIASHSL